MLQTLTSFTADVTAANILLQVIYENETDNTSFFFFKLHQYKNPYLWANFILLLIINYDLY